MIEIIPNWHPIFVHFTVGLFTTAFGLSVLAYLLKYQTILKPIYAAEFEITARWCLWGAAFITIFTVAIGFYAYYTVRHDEAGHLAMISHRNWALSTAVTMWLVTCWSWWRHYKHKNLTVTFLIALFIIEILLFSTAWHGGELVYRHGLGVMSLPHVENDQHHHAM